jgi:hypothetical protein
MARGAHSENPVGDVLDSAAGKLAVGFACLYALLGLILIPYTGIETDEAVFANPLYCPFNSGYGATVFHKHIPLMLFPYGGTLKTLIYWPILGVFGPNAYAVRLPVVIFGALTIVMFFKLAEKMAGVRAALLASLLLATDASFLLTNTYDWGPVALQQILLVTGCLAIARRRPVLGCFIFGLALWNKAIFIWALSGLAAAVIAAYLPEVRKTLASRRTVACCAGAFAAGALPLIVYNVHIPNATLHANVHLSLENLHAKVVSLKNTLNGSDLFGIVVAPETEEMPKSPRSAIGRLSCWIRDRIGPTDSSPFVYAILLALLFAPLWWRSGGRRAAVFSIVFLLVAFSAMAVTRYTGSAHHIVLLDPMPHLLVAVAVAALRPRWLAATAGTALIVANLLVVNQYIAQFERNGSYGLFTDALYPLSDSLVGSEACTVYELDFGIEDNLILLHEGRLKATHAWPIDSESDSEIGTMISDAGAVFVNHVPSRQYFKGADDRLDAMAKADGYERRTIRTIRDSNGRPQFELFRFERVR